MLYNPSIVTAAIMDDICNFIRGEKFENPELMENLKLSIAPIPDTPDFMICAEVANLYNEYNEVVHIGNLVVSDENSNKGNVMFFPHIISDDVVTAHSSVLYDFSAENLRNYKDYQNSGEFFKNRTSIEIENINQSAFSLEYNDKIPERYSNPSIYDFFDYVSPSSSSVKLPLSCQSDLYKIVDVTDNLSQEEKLKLEKDSKIYAIVLNSDSFSIPNETALATFLFKDKWLDYPDLESALNAEGYAISNHNYQDFTCFSCLPVEFKYDEYEENKFAYANGYYDYINTDDEDLYFDDGLPIPPKPYYPTGIKIERIPTLSEHLKETLSKVETVYSLTENNISAISRELNKPNSQYKLIPFEQFERTNNNQSFTADTYLMVSANNPTVPLFALCKASESSKMNDENTVVIKNPYADSDKFSNSQQLEFLNKKLNEKLNEKQEEIYKDKVLPNLNRLIVQMCKETLSGKAFVPPSIGHIEYTDSTQVFFHKNDNYGYHSSNEETKEIFKDMSKEDLLELYNHFVETDNIFHSTSEKYNPTNLTTKPIESFNLQRGIIQVLNGEQSDLPYLKDYKITLSPPQQYPCQDSHSMQRCKIYIAGEFTNFKPLEVGDYYLTGGYNEEKNSARGEFHFNKPTINQIAGPLNDAHNFNASEKIIEHSFESSQSEINFDDFFDADAIKQNRLFEKSIMQIFDEKSPDLPYMSNYKITLSPPIPKHDHVCSEIYIATEITDFQPLKIGEFEYSPSFNDNGHYPSFFLFDESVINIIAPGLNYINDYNPELSEVSTYHNTIFNRIDPAPFFNNSPTETISNENIEAPDNNEEPDL